MIERDKPLAPMTTYKLGGNAALFADVGTVAELEAVLAEAPGGVPVFVLGRGSNVLFSDRGFPGLVVRLGGEFLDIRRDGDVIEAGAAVPVPKLARFAAAEERSGLEFFVGWPGSVGGAVRMNAGGHGADTASVLIDASVLRSREVLVLTPSDLELAYRHSNLSDDDVVLAARFRTRDGVRADIEAEMRAITRWRKEHQPGGTHNAGSVFKNPPGDSAGRIIDSLGLKGYRHGAVSVSTMHANFLVAESGATAQDVYGLICEVRRIVREETGVDLEPELRLVGPFAPPSERGTT